jgi:hypothetical protein
LEGVVAFRVGRRVVAENLVGSAFQVEVSLGAKEAVAASQAMVGSLVETVGRAFPGAMEGESAALVA